MSQRPCPAENEDDSWPGVRVPDWMTWTVNPLLCWLDRSTWGSTQKLMLYIQWHSIS